MADQLCLYIVYWLTKKNAQNFWSSDLVHEKPFGYRVTLIPFNILSRTNLVIIITSTTQKKKNYKLELLIEKLNRLSGARLD